MKEDNFIRYFMTVFFIVLFIAISYKNYFKEELPTIFYCKSEGKVDDMSYCSIVRIELISVESDYYDYLKSNCSQAIEFNCTGYAYYGYYYENYTSNVTFTGELKRYVGCNCTKQYLRDNFVYYERIYNPFFLDFADKKKEEKRLIDWLLMRKK